MSNSGPPCCPYPQITCEGFSRTSEEEAGGRERSATGTARKTKARGGPRFLGAATPGCPRVLRYRASVREVLRTARADGLGGAVASWGADLRRGSGGGLLGVGVAVDVVIGNGHTVAGQLPIQRSAWNRFSAKFAGKEFSEVATRIHQKFIDSC